MAGSQDSDDNPVAINVVPMVDVIFCLCVFFMCSFKFKETEGRFDSWLPKKPGIGDGRPLTLLDEMRVALSWDDASATVTRRFGNRTIDRDDELARVVRAAHDDHVKAGRGDDPVVIDADPRVPWEALMTVVNLVKSLGIDGVEFAFGAGSPR